MDVCMCVFTFMSAGPENPWLIETYILSVPRPCASVFGQEIFQFGLVPSDTDFRIFRDFGHIPGIETYLFYIICEI